MENAPAIDFTNFRVAIDLAHVLRVLGDPESGDILLEGASEFVLGRPRSGHSGILFLDIEVLAMIGDSESALVALEKAAESDWTELWWQAPGNPNLSNLHQRPRFIAAIERLRSRAAEYRSNVELDDSDVR